MNVEVQYPEYIYLGISVSVIFIVITGVLLSKSYRTFKKIAERSFFNKIFKYYDKKRIVLKYSLRFFILIFLFLSAANPREYITTQKKQTTSCEIVFCLDISNSMLADDISPNRLEFARQTILNVLKNIDEDKVGIVVYAGSSAILQPLTSDYENMRFLVKSINTDYILKQGTNIEDALDRSVSLFNPSSSADKILILLTDGEEHEGQLNRISGKLKDLNVKLLIVGVGTLNGGPIPLSDGLRKDYKRDMNGNVVITKLREDLLKEVARQVNGLYLTSKSISQISSVLLQEIENAKRIESEKSMQSRFINLYYIPLLVACVFLFIDMIVFDYLHFIFKQ